MLFNYLKLYLRASLRNFSISVVTIGGLAIGMATCLLIIGYISSELSFDNYHSKKDRIHRMVWEYGNDSYTTRLQPIVGERMQSELAEVEQVIRLFTQDATVTTGEGEQLTVLKQEQLLYSDPEIFDVFDFEITDGDSKAFQQPYSLALTREAADRYFGDRDPVGQQMNVRNMFGSVDYTVRAVLENPPTNSSFQFEMILTNERLFSNEMSYLGILYWGAFDTFVLTRSENTDMGAMEELVNTLAQSADPEYGTLSFQPLEDIHLKSGFLNDGSYGMARIYAFATITLVILILAWFNFINLSTARSLERVKESGVRKVLGAGDGQLFRQFVFDAATTNLISLVFAVLLVEIISQGIGYYTNLVIDPVGSIGLSYLLLFVAVYIVGVVITAVIPFLFIRRLQPFQALTYKLQGIGPGGLMRKVLTFIQFGVSFFLLVFTLFIYQQVQFMEKQALGFGIDRTLIVSTPNTEDEDLKVRVQSFGNRLRETSWFRSISVSSAVPGRGYNYGAPGRLANQPEDDNIEIKVSYIDSSFVDHYRMNLISGITFNDFSGNPAEAVVINETTVSALGVTADEVLGRRIILGDNNSLEVIGVIRDYHHASLHTAIEPVAFRYSEFGNAFSIKYDAGDKSEVIDYVGSLYSQFFPLNAFEYVFLEDLFAESYLGDKRFGRLFGIFSLVALVIAVMGLYGLTELNAQRRVKEIGVRKVLGASNRQIFTALSKDSVVLIAISAIPAIPAVIMFNGQWLDSYAYKTEFSLIPVLISFIAITAISLITISFRANRASRANPVESLRYE